MMETFQELGEFGFIDRIAQYKQGGDILCGIGDLFLRSGREGAGDREA